MTKADKKKSELEPIKRKESLGWTTMSQKMTMDIVTPIRGGEDTIKHEVDNCRAVPEISKSEEGIICWWGKLLVIFQPIFMFKNK